MAIIHFTRFTASGGLLLAGLSLAAGPIVAGLGASPAAAEEPLAAAAAVAGVTVGDMRADHATAAPPAAPQAAPRVAIAVPVGRVMLGADDEGRGGPRYAVRADAAGSGMVRFSTLRPSVAMPGQGTAVTAQGVPLGLPLASARLTSTFGARRNPVTGLPGNHGGIDLGAPAGTPVATTGAGTVSFAGFAGSYGLLVVVNHGNGVQTRYAHLSRIGVARGQLVNRGDIVGLVGSTGRSTGPHLHYEVRHGQQAINPLSR